jgi:hypothetical protein
MASSKGRLVTCVALGKWLVIGTNPSVAVAQSPASNARIHPLSLKPAS